VGTLISPQRWYWAVMGAFVVFVRTETVGQVIRRSWDRVAGTAVGVIAGLHLARLVMGHRALALALLFASIFAAYYFLRVLYVLMVLALTLMLADLYGLLGSLTPAVLYLRLTETMVGCVLGSLVAVVVLPARTGPRLRAGLAQLLRALADLLEDPALSEGDGAAIRAQVRAVDQKLRAWEDLVHPISGTLLRHPLNAAARQLHLARTAIYFARQFALAAAFSAGDRTCLREAALPIAAESRALAAALDSDTPPEPAPPPPAPGPLADTPAQADPLYWLGRLRDAQRAVRDSVG
jgi:uncharacterized membrane protein YccC